MNALYDWLLDSAARAARDEPVRSLQIGLSWTLAEVADGLGFAFSPRQVPRTLGWAGTLRGQPSDQLRDWLLSWDAAQAVVGLALVNAAVNRASPCLRQAEPLRGEVPGHLRVFAHFRPRLDGQRVVVIGHYPGLERLWQDSPTTVWSATRRTAICPTARRITCCPRPTGCSSPPAAWPTRPCRGCSSCRAGPGWC